MDIKETMRRLGLPKHADTVYKTLEKKGPLIATDICKAAKLFRPSAYRALFALEQNHFVFQSKKGRRKLYHAASPVLIANAFSKTSAKVAKKMAEKAVADEQYQQKEIQFLDGFKGIQAAFDDTITHSKRSETFYRYTSEKDLDAVNRYLSKNYRARRDQKKLERMVISNPISGKRKKPRLERFVKYIPEEASLFDQNIIQLIYGNRVTLIDLNNERVIIIENKALADFQKVIFRQLYDKLPLP